MSRSRSHLSLRPLLGTLSARGHRGLLWLTISAAAPLASQSAPGAPAGPSSSTWTAPQQIAAAVLPLPETLRAGAAVYGWKDGTLVQLRPGTNTMRCLAEDPAKKNFHVACYHDALEPFMAAGRALTAKGLKREAVDSARRAQIAAKQWSMPAGPTLLYEIFGPEGAYDPATNTLTGAQAVNVIYMPYATAASTGLVVDGQKQYTPWLMYPGEPWAHVMLTP